MNNWRPRLTYCTQHSCFCTNNSHQKNSFSCQAFLWKGKSRDHIPQCRTQPPPDLHLKRDCVSNTRQQSTFDRSALRSGDRSEVAFVHWWDNFPKPVVFSPTTHAFSCRPLGLQSPQIKFLTVVPSVRKRVKQTLCKLFLFSTPLKLSEGSRLACEAAVSGAKSRAQGVIDFPRSAQRSSVRRATLLDTPSPTATRLHRYSTNSASSPPTALINSFVPPSACLFPQTNCWQKYLF